MEALIEIAPETIAVGRATRASGYAERLAAVLGDGSRWEFRGEVGEDSECRGKCACGHDGLRYLFTLHNLDGKADVLVGSSCVETYQGISPALVECLRAKVADLQAAERARIAAAKKAAQSEFVRGLMREWSALEVWADSLAQAWIDRHSIGAFKPYAVYRRWNYGTAARLQESSAPGYMHPYCRVPALKTPTGQAARIRNSIAATARIVEELKSV